MALYYFPLVLLCLLVLSWTGGPVAAFAELLAYLLACLLACLFGGSSISTSTHFTCTHTYTHIPSHTHPHIYTLYKDMGVLVVAVV